VEGALGVCSGALSSVLDNFRESFLNNPVVLDDFESIGISASAGTKERVAGILPCCLNAVASIMFTVRTGESPFLILFVTNSVCPLKVTRSSFHLATPTCFLPLLGEQ